MGVSSECLAESAVKLKMCHGGGVGGSGGGGRRTLGKRNEGREKSGPGGLAQMTMSQGRAADRCQGREIYPGGAQATSRGEETGSERVHAYTHILVLNRQNGFPNNQLRTKQGPRFNQSEVVVRVSNNQRRTRR